MITFGITNILICDEKKNNQIFNICNNSETALRDMKKAQEMMKGSLLSVNTSRRSHKKDTLY